VLGYSDDRIAALREKGVLQSARRWAAALILRHCEEANGSARMRGPMTGSADEAIQSAHAASGLLRFARNDGLSAPSQIRRTSSRTLIDWAPPTVSRRQ
jgi:hypothetical protein